MLESTEVLGPPGEGGAVAPDPSPAAPAAEATPAPAATPAAAKPAPKPAAKAVRGWRKQVSSDQNRYQKVGLVRGSL